MLDDRYEPWDDEGGGGPWPGLGPNGGAPAAPAAPVAPPIAASGGNGLGNGGGGGGYSASLRPIFHFADAPEFHAPQFHQPTFAEAQNEPGYQFRLDGGRGALERSAAARGVLRTGGTLKDTMEYGQNFAAQEYQNVFNRAKDAFEFDYRGKHDEFLPKFDEWRFLSAAEQTAAMAQFAHQNQGHGGGGGGGSYEQDVANAPPPVAPPNFLIKHNNPHYDDYMNWNNPGGGYHSQGEMWPERY